MNYATLTAPNQETLTKALNAACQALAHRLPFQPKIAFPSQEFGYIEIKDGCIMPFFLKLKPQPLVMTVYSVDIFGLQRHHSQIYPKGSKGPDWNKYQSNFLVLDAYTYITALLKMLIAQQLNQKLDDEGIGKYFVDPNHEKFTSLAAWRKYHLQHRKNFSIVLRGLRLFNSRTSLAQDKKYFPELFAKK